MRGEKTRGARPMGNCVVIWEWLCERMRAKMRWWDDENVPVGLLYKCDVLFYGLPSSNMVSLPLISKKQWAGLLNHFWIKVQSIFHSDFYIFHYVSYIIIIIPLTDYCSQWHSACSKSFVVSHLIILKQCLVYIVWV